MSSVSDPRSRSFRKGQRLFRQGEPRGSLFLLQSGLVSLRHEVGEDSHEIGKATAPQLIGEEALFGAGTWSLTAVAVNDTEALELTLAEAQALIDSLPGALKAVVRSAIQKQEALIRDLVEGPQEKGSIPGLFAILYHAAISTGRAKDGKLTVVWPAYRKYCHWGLLESPVRLEQAVQLLARLGYAELQMVQSETDPEAPEELGFVHFNPERLEELKGFYRFYHQQGQAQTELGMQMLPEAEPYRGLLGELSALRGKA